MNDSLSKTIQENIQKSISNNNSVSPFLKYIGGKQAIADKLIPLIPKHKIYCEPFLGSGALFFKKPKAQSNMLNDFNGDLVNMFMQVRDKREEFLEWIWLTPLSEKMHEAIFRTYQSDMWYKLSPLKRACGYYYILQLAYNESVGNLGHPSMKIDLGKQKWNQSICNEVFKCSVKLENCIITHRSYSSLIEYDALNKKHTFWYFDPPYSMADDKGYYSHNFLPNNHHEFLIFLRKIEGKFMVSYDDHPMILEIFKEFYLKYVPGYSNEIIFTNYNTDELLSQKPLI